MCINELLKNMFRSFFIITTGIVVSMYVFCLLFEPNARFSLDDIGRILLMALASDLPFFIFLSRREPSKRQMLARQIIHLLVLSAVLLYFASLWDWIELNNSAEVIIFLLLIFAVYIAVIITIKYRDKKMTEQMNDRLKKRYRS
jgi:Protein of unknown function (DUF3021).